MVSEKGLTDEEMAALEASSGGLTDAQMAELESKSYKGPSIIDQLISDAPYLAGSALQAIPGPIGMVAGAAGTIAENPLSFATAGFPGAKVNEGAKLVNLISGLLGGPHTNTLESTGITSAKTPAGQIAQLGVDLLGPAVGAKFTKPDLPKVFDDYANKTNFLDDVRSAFYDAKSTAVDKYGAGLERLSEDNPDKYVSIRPVVDDLNQQIAMEPKLRNAINKVPVFSKWLDNPEAANKVTLKEAQGIVNDLQSKISSGKLKGVGVRPDDIPLLDAIHEIKGQMLEAFPELKELRKDYGEIINKFNLVKGKLKPGSLAKNIETNFGGDPEIQKASKDLLSEFPEIMARMRNFRTMRAVGDLVRAGAKTAGIGTLLGASAKTAYDALHR